jgi:hypothetical protein
MFRCFIAIIVSLLLVMGCAGPQADQGTAEPGTSPTLTVPPTPVPATMTKEVSLPEALPAVRIRNANTGTYLFEKDGQAQLGDISDETSYWVIEDYQGTKRFQNKGSKRYLSIEHLKPFVEVIEIYPEWMSPRWKFDADPSGDSIAIRNVWHNWQVLYTDDGLVKYENIPTDNDHARWFLEPVDGSGMTASTPIPVVIIPPATNPVGSRGADVPWIEYEAETSTTNGEVLVPDRTFGKIASESSGRSAVKLDQAGEYVQFQSTEPANSVVVRFVIPDSEDGTGVGVHDQSVCG